MTVSNHRPYKIGNVSVSTTLRITPAARDRMDVEARARNITASGLLAELVEAIVEGDLFKAVLDDDVTAN